jgi:hypothetical protein
MTRILLAAAATLGLLWLSASVVVTPPTPCFPAVEPLLSANDDPCFHAGRVQER